MDRSMKKDPREARRLALSGVRQASLNKFISVIDIRRFDNSSGKVLEFANKEFPSFDRFIFGYMDRTKKARSTDDTPLSSFMRSDVKSDVKQLLLNRFSLTLASLAQKMHREEIETLREQEELERELLEIEIEDLGYGEF